MVRSAARPTGAEPGSTTSAEIGSRHVATTCGSGSVQPCGRPGGGRLLGFGPGAPGGCGIPSLGPTSDPVSSLGWNGPAARSGKVGITEQPANSAAAANSTEIARPPPREGRSFTSPAGLGIEARTVGRLNADPYAAGEWPPKRLLPLGHRALADFDERVREPPLAQSHERGEVTHSHRGQFHFIPGAQYG